ncbi:cytochrome P450 ClCP1 [Clohesyomyces aquaticus]|uniref:Cytochrome P450 ClCP1 n=1 Tax=Clohesyomyces aquaticus TaxID=1231657 RepID=A0A1Y1Z5C1_9PLEO|nr:cytochrome P450 ClCP1 [Clohesyomyces aquaticus]
MALLIGALVALVLYYTIKAFYNLYLHPLARYPGPKLWIVSRIPYLVSMNSGKLPFRIKELHDQYGPVVRLSADELSFNDPCAWKDVYNRRDMLRPPRWGVRPPGVSAHSVISAPARDHARFRKALNPGFSEKATRSYEPAIRTYFEKLLARLDSAVTRDGNSTVIDIVYWANLTTFDVIGELVWSKGYNCLETGAGHAFMGVLLHFQAFLAGATLKYYPWLHACLAYITPKSAFRLLEDIFKDTHHRIENRLLSGRTSHADIVGYLQAHNKTATVNETLSFDEIEQNLLAIIVGGSKTLTTIFSGLFHHILADNVVYQKLTREVRSSFSSSDDITASACATLPYLNAAIEETLRMCAPILDALRRQVPASGATIAGLTLPAHTTVSVSCYTMFKSSRHFENPESFEPERWLEKEKKDNAAFYPFGLGPHNCLGQPLARLEMRVLLALLLHRYEFKVPRGGVLRKWDEQKIYWTWAKEPLMVEIRRVER